MLRLNKNQNSKSEHRNSMGNRKSNDLSEFLHKAKKDMKIRANSKSLKRETLNDLEFELTGLYPTNFDYFLDFASSGRL